MLQLYDFSLAGGVLTVRVPDGAEAALDMFTGMLAVR